jgi:hypothetical protein
MRRILLSCGLFLAAFATARFVVFQVTPLASLSTHSKEESFKAGGLRSFEIVPLETVSETSANASIGDLNGDGYPDIVLVKGRHWQVPSRIFFGDGTVHFTPGPALPSKATKSYSGSLADMTKSGHLDMVLSNDEPDPKLILLNDGKGNFTIELAYAPFHSNLLNSFPCSLLVANRFASGIKLVRGRATRRNNREFQANGSHYRLQHRLRQAVHRNAGSQGAHRFRHDA